MPGIPKSKACQRCKTRKIKCDQQWPQCGPCKQRDYPCPGPSSLLKFVHGGPQADHRRSRSRSREVSPTHSSVSSTSNSGASSSKANSMESTFSFPSLPQEHGSYSILRLTAPPPPRVKPTTVADRVAGRLVSQLEASPELINTFQMKYLKYLPPLLSSSPCLRDSVALFCSAWASYRRRQPAGDFMSMESYGKALRSLRRSLDGEQAYSLETLAAITLLERSESLFDRAREPCQLSHTEGILWLIVRQGPPKLGDKLHAGLLFENSASLILYWFVNEGNNFLNDSPWREAMEDTASEFLSRAIRPHAMPTIRIINRLYARWPRFLRTAQRVYNITNSRSEARPFIIDFLDDLSEAETESRLAFEDLMEKAFALGEITESHDATSLCGQSYQVSSVYFGQVLLDILSLRLGLLRIIMEMSHACELQNTAILSVQYQALCVQTWKFMPFIYSLDPLIAPNCLTAFTMAFEGADTFERDRLLDMTMEVDSYRQSLSRDKDTLATGIIQQAMMLTGRLPMDI